jgi:hypothetical protein
MLHWFCFMSIVGCLASALDLTPFVPCVLALLSNSIHKAVHFSDLPYRGADALARAAGFLQREYRHDLWCAPRATSRVLQGAARAPWSVGCAPP